MSPHMNALKILFLTLFLLSCGKSVPPVSDAAVDAGTQEAAALAATHAPTWSVHFSPKGGCQDAIIAHIKSAKKTVRLAAYGFTSQPIADALIERKNAGVDVQLVLDRTDRSEPGTKAPALNAAGVALRLDAKHTIMHNKYIVVDGVAVENGSYNFTTAAENANAENCLIEHNTALAQAYEADWNVHWAHSNPF
jgi:phosphatidylserine/phosphatidylglycerophosphate/cardiolipin synthase-like enzyme